MQQMISSSAWRASSSSTSHNPNIPSQQLLKNFLFFFLLWIICWLLLNLSAGGRKHKMSTRESTKRQTDEEEFHLSARRSKEHLHINKIMVSPKQDQGSGTAQQEPRSKSTPTSVGCLEEDCAQEMWSQSDRTRKTKQRNKGKRKTKYC